MLSHKYKQLTNQLQFDYEISLTINHCDSILRMYPISYVFPV